MFSLVIAIVSIALVVAVVLAGSHYGGETVANAAAQADAARLKSEEHQILAAVDVFNADKGRFPNDVQELVDTGYLKTIPRGSSQVAAAELRKGITVAGLLAVAQAYAADSGAIGWYMPAAGQPVFETTSNVPALTCAKYNQVSRGDDGILKQAYTSQRAQCYGVDGDYRVVVNKVGAASGQLNSALPSGSVLEGNLPVKSGDVFWDRIPSGDIKVATDPNKKPFAELVMTPSSETGEDFGGVELGKSATSSARLVVNRGNIPTTGMALSAPAGFGIANSSCAVTLGPGASCSFAVRFAPDAIGAYGGDVTLASENGGVLSFPVVAQGHQAKLAVGPSSAAFGTIQTGQTAQSAVVTASNAGDIPTTGLSVTPPAGYSLSNNTCGSSIAAGSSCSFRVVFEPTQARAYSGTLQVTSANAGAQSVSLTGAGQAPSATLSNLDFGDVDGGSSVQQLVTLTNTGIGPLTLTAPSPASISGADFSFISTTCASPLAAGQSCTVTVKYTANGASASTGSLSMTTGAGVKTAALAGQGRRALFSLSPNSVSFGTVQVGDTPTSSTVTLTNTGNVTTTGLSLSPMQGFTVVNSTCPAGLAAGASCTFAVKFTPTLPQVYGNSMSVTAGNGTTANLGTSGTGKSPSATLSTSLAFGSVALASANEQVATLTNTGVGALAVSAPVVTGTDFSLASTTCGATLTAGQSCTATVRFAPSVIGASSGTLSITTAAGAKMSTLSGSGLGSVATLTSPTSATLADWYQSGTVTLNVSYRNDGNANLTLASPTLTSPLSVAANNCTNVAPGASCAITVALARDANTGGSSSQAFVAQGADVAPSQIVLNWSIYSRIPKWNLTSWDFGGVNVGSSATKSFVVTNNGSVAADWSGASALTLPAGFTSNLAACTNVVPGGSCTVTITFAPTTAQAYSATGVGLDPSSFAANTLALSGSGVAVVGEVSYTTAGTYSWTVPVGVYNVSFVAIGGGAMGNYGGGGGIRVGGGGGALVYRNNLSVTPGQVMTVKVGADGSSGGAGGTSSFGGAYAGGGTGGYAGPAGGNPSGTYTAGFPGGSAYTEGSFDSQAGGCAGGYKSAGCIGHGYTGQTGTDLFGGSGGTKYGQGGNSSAYGWGAPGGTGAVRIIWGPGRSFPSNAS